MANIKLGSIVADIRGSVGDETYGRNQGGNFVRSKPIPTGVATQDQLDCRAAMKAVQLAWSATLSEQQRTDWRAYAHQHPRRNCWGDATLTNGFCRFVRTNVIRRRVQGTINYLNPPTAPPLYPPLFTIAAYDNDGMRIFVPLDNYDPPFEELRLWAFTGKPMPVGVSYYSGPFRYNEKNLFSNGTWQQDPWYLLSHWDIVTGDKVWIRLIAQHRSSGEISEASFANCIVT